MTDTATYEETLEAQIEAGHNRRVAADDRAWARMDRRLDDAETMVGELCREGARVFYINQRSKTGALTGETVEFATAGSARDYLIRNRYA